MAKRENDLEISVVIATAGSAGRARALDRAIKSVLNQEGVRPIPIVVLNGDLYSPDIRSSLAAHTGIRFIQVSTPGVSNARLLGRQAVDTPYFSLLDDDDEILPNGCAMCHSYFATDPSLDVVTGNGYLDYGGRRVVAFANTASHPDDPAAALIEEQWLASGSAVFRSSTVSVTYFENLPDILEWTYLALRLALERRIKRICNPVFVKYEGNPDQVTSTARYHSEAPETLKRMIGLKMPPTIRDGLRTKLAAALHQAAEFELNAQDHRRAWGYHLESLLIPGGLQYATFTRRLIAASLRVRSTTS